MPISGVSHDNYKDVLFHIMVVSGHYVIHPLLSNCSCKHQIQMEALKLCDNKSVFFFLVSYTDRYSGIEIR